MGWDGRYTPRYRRYTRYLVGGIVYRRYGRCALSRRCFMIPIHPKFIRLTNFAEPTAAPRSPTIGPWRTPANPLSQLWRGRYRMAPSASPFAQKTRPEASIVSLLLLQGRLRCQDAFGTKRSRFWLRLVAEGSLTNRFPKVDKLVIAQLGQLAQRRLARGAKLNHGEACVR
jgi:hypothetical protein